MCLTFAVSVSAGIVDSGVCGDNLTWTFDDEGTLTISGEGKMDDIADMDIILGSSKNSNGSIKEWYMELYSIRENVKMIIIEDGIENISMWVFHEFENLETVVLGKSLKSIGMASFAGCKRLTEINIPSSVTNIGERAFYKCENLKNIIIPDSVTVLKNEVFAFCSNLEDVNIPQSVTSIEHGAFEHCSSLKSIEIPSTVTNIEGEAFRDTGLESIVLPNGITTIKTSTFKACKSLKRVELPTGLTAIEMMAFTSCTYLESVNFPESLTSVDVSAFSGCPFLVIYGTPGTIAENYANTYPHKFPFNGVKTESSGICGENIIWSIDESGTLTIKGNGNMYDWISNPSDIVTTYPSSQPTPWHYKKKDITKVIIEDGVTNIGKNSFCYCPNLIKIELPDSLISIGDSVFVDCKKLESIDIPSSVKDIGFSAFHSCESLKKVELPYGLTAIDAMFTNCSNLESITIPNSVTTIDHSAFSSCKSLTSITIPENVEYIGNMSFIDCDNLSSIILYGISTDIMNYGNVFDNCDNLTIYGKTNSKSEIFAKENNISFCTISTAIPTNAKVLINGKEVAFTAYNIGGNNYFKLRDVAMALNGSEKNFNVGWDGKNNAISLTSNQNYIPVGGELVVDTNAASTEPIVTNSRVYKDGESVSFIAFNIGGNNYFKLRDIGKAFDFGIGWDNETKTITIDTSISYTE